MSRITCVYWLESGRLFAERSEPDTGLESVGTEYKVQRPKDTRDVMIRLYDAAVPVLPVYFLTFRLTEGPYTVAEQYALGRRRFHYREASGWKSDEDRMEEDLLGDAKSWRRFARELPEMMRQDEALREVGSFPVHSCAPPPGWCALKQLLGPCADAKWASPPTLYDFSMIFPPTIILPPIL